MKINKLVMTAIALTALTGNAMADDDTFETRFQYNKNDSVESNYATFKHTAEQACRDEIKRTVRQNGKMPLSVTARYGRSCQAELMDKVVKATKMEVFIAYHNANKSKAG